MWITGVETIKRHNWDAYGCLVASQSPVAAGLAYGLYAVRPLCLWHSSTVAASVAACGAI